MTDTSQTTTSTRKLKSPTKKKRRRRRRPERCQCGLDECNDFQAVLGSVLRERCSYTHPDGCLKKTQRLRSTMIHNKLCEWRRVFCPNDNPEPSTNGRFNEIHYPVDFLEYARDKGNGNNKSVCKMIPIDKAKDFGMFKSEYVVGNFVVVVPSLTSRDAWRIRREDDYESGVDVKPSKVHGKGLFAKKRFNDGEIICRYSGTLVPDDGTTTIVSDFLCTVGETKDGRTTRYHIDSTDPANSSGRWCNHSVLPNARLVVPRAGIKKYKDEQGFLTQTFIFVQCCSPTGINRGQEIRINYGMEYFTNEKGELDKTLFYSGIKVKIST